MYKRRFSHYPPYCLKVCLLLLFCRPFASSSSHPSFTISSTISSMSDDGMFCLNCKRLFGCRRSFSGHVCSCQRSQPVRSAFHNQLAPILQHQSADVINASSSTVNVPVSDPTIGVITNTTTSSRLETSASAESFSGGILDDSTFFSLDADVLLLSQFADTSNMDVDISRHLYSSDDEMPNETGILNCEESSVLADGDHYIIDDDLASSNEDVVDVANVKQPDLSLMSKYNTYLSSGMGQMKASIAYQRDIELLRILMKAKAPVYLFDQIKECFRTTVHVSKINLLDKSARLSRKAVLKQIYQKFDLHGSQPKEIEVTLPGSNEIVRVVTHDFKEQLYSLLSDPVVMQDEHLLFSKNENGEYHPFADPRIVPQQNGNDAVVYHDVTDGDAYKTAYEFHCTVKDTDVLLCIIIFMDKSHVDSTNGRLCFEPMMFTLSIFKKEVRTRPLFWRPLGFVVNQSNLSNVHSSLKSDDYHFMIRILLRSLVDVQRGSGISWRLSYQATCFDVVFKLPVLFVVGDTEGHDKMCGKFLSRTNQIPRLCRYCDCPTDDTDLTTHVFSPTLGPEIAQMVADGEKEELRLIAYHCVQNGFYGIVFCDQERGINGATPAEILHVWQHGLFPRALAALFGQKRALKRASIGKKDTVYSGKPRSRNPRDQPTAVSLVGFVDIPVDSDDDDDEETDKVLEDVLESPLLESEDVAQTVNPISQKDWNLSNSGIFTDTVKSDFDACAKKYGRMLAHQSNREFDRSYFPSGITTNAKKNGHEEKCVILLCLLILVSKKGVDCFEKQFDGEQAVIPDEGEPLARSQLFIELLTNLLLMENFLKSKQFTRRQMKLYKVYLPLFMDLYKLAVQRVIGMAMKFIKFHLPMHSYEDIRRFGPPMSWDSSTGESNHKDMKDPGRHTQQNTINFDMQTAKRFAENTAIRRAIYRENPPQSMLTNVSSHSHVARQTRMSYSGFNYVVTKDGMTEKNPISRTKPWIPANWPNSALQLRVLQLIWTNVLPHVPSGSMKVFTKLKWQDDGTIFRANPSYGKSGQSWHDWAEIDWDPESNNEANVIPGRLIVFMQLDDFDLDTAFTAPEYFFIDGAGTYAVIESLIESIYAVPPTKCMQYLNLRDYFAHPYCNIVYWSSIEQEHNSNCASINNAAKLYVVPTNRIIATQIVIPYDLDNPDGPEQLIIAPMNTWMDAFIDEMKFRIDNNR